MKILHNHGNWQHLAISSSSESRQQTIKQGHKKGEWGGANYFDFLSDRKWKSDLWCFELCLTERGMRSFMIVLSEDAVEEEDS